MYDDGYKYLREADERAVLLEADLYMANSRPGTTNTNTLLVAAVGLALGAGIAFALKDETDFYKYLAGGGAACLLIWSFK